MMPLPRNGKISEVFCSYLRTERLVATVRTAPSLCNVRRASIESTLPFAGNDNISR
jgi:hypothetical protein